MGESVETDVVDVLHDFVVGAVGLSVEHLQTTTLLGVKTSEKMLAHDKSINCVKGHL